MKAKQSNLDKLKWIKYLVLALICGLIAIDGITSAIADSGKSKIPSSLVVTNSHPKCDY